LINLMATCVCGCAFFYVDIRGANLRGREICTNWFKKNGFGWLTPHTPFDTCAPSYVLQRTLEGPAVHLTPSVKPKMNSRCCFIIYRATLGATYGVWDPEKLCISKFFFFPPTPSISLSDASPELIDPPEGVY